MPASAGNRVAVIGAGLSGLAVAARLAAKGKPVHVFEQNAYFGGKATIREQGEFLFDTGPSLFTLPAYVDEVFEACGKGPRDYYHYKELKTLCHYFYEDGLFLKATADKELFGRELENNTKDKAGSLYGFLAHAAEIHRLTEPVFLRKSLHVWKNYLSEDTLRGLLGFSKIDAFASMETVIRRYFKDERVIQLFCRYATYNGSNPYKAPGTLNVIPHLEFGLGAFMPEGGIHAIPKALYALCRDMGVEFTFNARVEGIETKGKKVSGIRVNGSFYPADCVVSNADIWPTYRILMPAEKAPEKTLAQERSSSAFIFYWGMDKEFPELDVHNIFFSQDYKKEFASLFDDLAIAEDPTVYVHISSKICPEHAPKGGENWFVMVNAPQHSGQDWEELKETLRTRILTKLERILNKNLSPHIVNESVLSPADIESQTSSYRGSLYGTSSNNRFAAFLRHPNFSTEIKGLYFCGGSVHPGGGIPLVMASARIVGEMVG
ncbi:MAG TPA: phytoene desaturase [Bacteroidetes bacterium]|nr:phytoene desaturase [Bacteroidota bacterium]